MLVDQRAPFGGKLDLIGISMKVGLTDTYAELLEFCRDIVF